MEPLRVEQIARIKELLPNPQVTLRQIGECAETTYEAVLQFIDEEFGLGRGSATGDLSLVGAASNHVDASASPATTATNGHFSSENSPINPPHFAVSQLPVVLSKPSQWP